MFNLIFKKLYIDKLIDLMWALLCILSAVAIFYNFASC